MNPAWSDTLLSALERLDLREAPHGLYGLRTAYAPAGRPQPLTHLLGPAGPTGFLRDCAFPPLRPAHLPGLLCFAPPAEEPVALAILDYATTKVRAYGSGHQLDRRQGPVTVRPPPDLHGAVARVRRKTGWQHAILLLAHHSGGRGQRELGAVLPSAVFCARHRAAHFARDWPDRHGRGIHTALHLWIPADAASVTAHGVNDLGGRLIPKGA